MEVLAVTDGVFNGMTDRVTEIQNRPQAGFSFVLSDDFRLDLAAPCDDVTEQCGLQEILERPIGKLSKGLRQRVGLAVALLHDPDVLIMDEPTSGLDPNQIRRFRGQVQQLREKKTLLISTHILHEMEMIADRVLLVSAGRLVFDGRPDEMRAQGSLEECFYRLTHSAC